MINPFGLSKVKHVIAVSSCKGGVGKSTIAVALARILKERGLSVGIFDADVYGPCVPALLNIKDTPEIFMDEFKMLLPAEYDGFKVMSFKFLAGDEPILLRGPIVTRYLQQMLLQTNWGQLDFLVIDMPPGTGDVAITVAQSIKLSTAIIVTTRQDLSVEVMARGVKMFDHLKVPMLGLIENMSYVACNDCQKPQEIYGPSRKNELKSQLNLPTLAEIPFVRGPIDSYLKPVVDLLTKSL